jgi:hypothetical protein
MKAGTLTFAAAVRMRVLFENTRLAKMTDFHQQGQVDRPR